MAHEDGVLKDVSLVLLRLLMAIHDGKVSTFDPKHAPDYVWRYISSANELELEWVLVATVLAMQGRLEAARLRLADRQAQPGKQEAR